MVITTVDLKAVLKLSFYITMNIKAVCINTVLAESKAIPKYLICIVKSTAVCNINHQFSVNSRHLK